MPKKKEVKVTDVEVARAIIEHEAASCFYGKEGPVAKQPTTLTSCIGGAFFGLAGESWPVTADGEPLIPWLQINCADVKGAYGAFHVFKAICFYFREVPEDYEWTSSFDGAEFVVREYPKDAKLTALKRPKSLDEHPYRRVKWTKQLDYPCISKYDSLFDDSTYTTLCDRKNLKFQNRSGIKIGGWPTAVQSPQQYPGHCDLQIDMTENYMYGDSGIGYLSRVGERWSLMFESC